MAGIPTDSDLKLLPRQQKLIDYWSTGPWEFLTGVDTDGTPVVRTRDERDKKYPVKPFPAYLPYVQAYLQILSDPDETFIEADKPRQMLFSYTTLGYMLWEILFLPGRRWLLSKSTEDEAKEMIRDKIRFTCSLMPPWFREYMGISDKPELRVDCKRTGSYILGVAQNFASREARGSTASGIFVDEACFQDGYEEIITSVLPMSAKIVAVSTPNPGTPGDDTFYSYMDDVLVSDLSLGKGRGVMDIIKELQNQAAVARAKKYPQVHGMSVGKTRRGVCVIHLDYWADPFKDARWAEKQRSLMPNEGAWRREYLRDRNSPAGKPFFPEFQLSQKKYIKPLVKLAPWPVYRGWDFGSRNPACVWLQASPKTGRVRVIRELMPEGLDTYSFRDLVLYMSGQRDRSFLDRRPKALEWLQLMESDENTPEYLRITPWFAYSPLDPIQYLDYSGHEANMTIAELASTTEEQTKAMILNAEGIFLNHHYTSAKAKVDVLRRLLGPLQDGGPGLVFDPACKILIQGFAGGVVFAKPTPTHPNPNVPAKDKKFSHLYEALGYVVVNAVPLLEPDPGRDTPAYVVGHDGGRGPIMSDEVDPRVVLDADYTVVS